MASDKAKSSKIVRSARSIAYRAALSQGFSEEVAWEKGESAANAKKSELSSLTGLSATKLKGYYNPDQGALSAGVNARQSKGF